MKIRVFARNVRFQITLEHFSAIVKTCSESDVGDLLEASQTHLDEGVSAFSYVDDSANLALLYSNTGRLLRLRAHFRSAGKQEPVEVLSPLRL